MHTAYSQGIRIQRNKILNAYLQHCQRSRFRGGRFAEGVVDVEEVGVDCDYRYPVDGTDNGRRGVNTIHFEYHSATY